MPSLFDPITLGEYELKNRIFMAPLTRGRSGPQGVPDRMVAEYYAQRTDAGLLIAEATAINPQGHGWFNAPGIYTEEQVAGWRDVADAVHARGGRIFMQIWHMGRTVLPEYANGESPVAPVRGQSRRRNAVQGRQPTPLRHAPRHNHPGN